MTKFDRKAEERKRAQVHADKSTTRTEARASLMKHSAIEPCDGLSDSFARSI